MKGYIIRGIVAILLIVSILSIVSCADGGSGITANIGIGTYRGPGMSSVDPTEKEVTTSDPDSHYIFYSAAADKGFGEIWICMDGKVVDEIEDCMLIGEGPRSLMGHRGVGQHLENNGKFLIGKHIFTIIVVDTMGNVATDKAVITVIKP